MCHVRRTARSLGDSSELQCNHCHANLTWRTSSRVLLAVHGTVAVITAASHQHCIAVPRGVNVHIGTMTQSSDRVQLRREAENIGRNAPAANHTSRSQHSIGASGRVGSCTDPDHRSPSSHSLPSRSAMIAPFNTCGHNTTVGNFVLSSRPSEVLEVVDIDLPRPRDQIATKSLPEFVRHRTHILRLIQRTTAETE